MEEPRSLWESAQDAAEAVQHLSLPQAMAALEMARVSVEVELVERRGKG